MAIHVTMKFHPPQLPFKMRGGEILPVFLVIVFWAKSIIISRKLRNCVRGYKNTGLSLDVNAEYTKYTEFHTPTNALLYIIKY